VKQSKRHQEIIDIVKTQGYVSTDDLVERFNVSPQTIRRDLNELAAENKIRRHHGGATIPSSSVNTSYTTRKVMQLVEKDRIAEAMAEHIPDGATLFIDIGTTPEAVARALLNHNDLRIVTNNLNVASVLTGKDDFRVILAGGEVRNRDGGIVGEATLDFISQFRLDFGIMGISGIDLDGSLLDFDYHEVRVKQAIIENSRCVMLGADHTKFGRNAMVNLGDISQIDMLFTDEYPPESLAKLITEHEIHMEVVGQNNAPD
jgi:DeoR family transcriptional regulator, glycerol-3-phosphate regulon repressor